MIPRVFHFIFLTKPLGDKVPVPFGVIHYFCLLSCIETQKAHVVVHTDGEITGPWWDSIKDEVEVRQRTFTTSIDGKQLQYFSHVADYARMEIIFQEGGVYADIDTIFVRSLQEFLDRDQVTVQIEPDGSPINSIIIAPPRSPVVTEWMKHSHMLTNGSWNDLSRKVLPKLREQFPDQLHFEQLDKLPHPAWSPTGAQALFIEDIDLGDSYLINLCQAVNWEKHINGKVREDTVFEYNSTLNRVIRRYITPPKFDFTAIIPARIDHQDRLENVLVVTNYLLNQLCVEHVIVVESGPKPKLPNLLDDRIRYLYVTEKPDDTWNKAKLVNTAMPWISTTAMGIWDADVLISLIQLRSAVSVLVDQGHKACIPCNQMLHIKREFLSDAQAGRMNPGGILADESNISFIMNPSTAAGLFMMRTEVFKHLRGMNEQYWGWGYEDDEMLLRVLRLIEGDLVKVSGPLFHFCHTRLPHSWPLEKEGRRSEIQRARAAKAPVEELRAYLGISEEIGHYVSEAHPRPATEEEEQWADKLMDTACSDGNPGYLTPHAGLPLLRRR